MPRATWPSQGVTASGVQLTNQKGQPGGYPALGADGKIPAAQLPTIISGSAAARPTGTRVAAIGDSNSSNGNNLAYWLLGMPGSLDGRSILMWATLLSKGRATYAGSYGVGGTRTAQIHSTQVPQILAASPKPDVCLVVAGTNDTTDFVTAAAFTAWQTEYAAMCDDLNAGGVLPIISTILPRQGWTTSDAQYLTKQNHWLLRFAADRGYPVVDFFTVTAQETSSLYTATLTTDNLHLNEAGAKACGQALADVLSTVLPPMPAQLAQSNPGAGLTTPYGMNNPLHLIDTNADGIPDRWLNNNATVTTITDLNKAKRGKVVQAIRGAAADGQTYVNNLPLVPGNRLLLAFTYAAQHKGVGGKSKVQFAGSDGKTNLMTITDLVEDVPDGCVWQSEIVVPATSPFDGSATPANANFSLWTKTAQNAAGWIGQFTYLDLTAAGFA